MKYYEIITRTRVCVCVYRNVSNIIRKLKYALGKEKIIQIAANCRIAHTFFSGKSVRKILIKKFLKIISTDTMKYCKFLKWKIFFSQLPEGPLHAMFELKFLSTQYLFFSIVCFLLKCTIWELYKIWLTLKLFFNQVTQHMQNIPCYTILILWKCQENNLKKKSYILHVHVCSTVDTNYW